MTLTNFPNGITVNGVPILGGGGLFMTGNAYFVRPITGNDNNSGTDPSQALKTLTEAHDRCVANNNDVVYLISESNTASATTDYQSSTLTWSKDLTHLVGVAAPSMVSQRARVANTSATAFSPLITWSADGCICANIQFFHGVADASALVDFNLTGTRNYFENVHFAGVGDSTQSATGACSLKLDAAAENVFKKCVIGLDTSSYDADATGILCDTAATRNHFEDCLIQGYISAAGYAHVTIADGTGIDRWLTFKNCLFLAESTNKAVAQTSVFSIPAISQGKVLLFHSGAVSDGGAVDWDSNNRGIVWNDAVAAAASAAGGILTNQ